MSETKNIPDTIREFAERLVKEKGFSGLDPEVLEQIIVDVADRLEDHVNAAIVNNLPADKMAEFERVLKEEDVDAIQDFCSAHVQDLENVIASSLIRFRSIYLGI